MGSMASLHGVPHALPHEVPGPKGSALQLPGGAVFQQQWQAMLCLTAASPEPCLMCHACLAPSLTQRPDSGCPCRALLAAFKADCWPGPLQELQRLAPVPGTGHVQDGLLTASTAGSSVNARPSCLRSSSRSSPTRAPMTNPTESVTKPAWRDAWASSLALHMHLPAPHLTLPQHAAVCWCPASHDHSMLIYKNSSCMLLSGQEPKMRLTQE